MDIESHLPVQYELGVLMSILSMFLYLFLFTTFRPIPSMVFSAYSRARDDTNNISSNINSSRDTTNAFWRLLIVFFSSCLKLLARLRRWSTRFSFLCLCLVHLPSHQPTGGHVYQPSSVTFCSSSPFFLRIEMPLEYVEDPEYFKSLWG
ncbi:hypothetical protein BDN70DRAFT_153012 [Pholiota conissans]|uniref:Uncharacterized protein n=1 Tax=Pholiota conissans TaxID=109636 RepID=A0A9P5YZJ3_9AGAR|nr:hypothetical protein BDN70DRAFT_153012 [Pholiota conissans]